MASFQNLQDDLRARPRKWLVTGAAGFIGSNLARSLLDLNQKVTGLDDLSSGSEKNITNLDNKNFKFIKGDIRDKAACRAACENIDIILHHAAIASVVKSVQEPEFVTDVNRGGFLTVLDAAKEAGVKRVVYASSSAVYGDASDKPRHEDETPTPLSPYAVTKLDNEEDALSSGLETIGLRYFNIYGPGQDHDGAYAAVIPKWLKILREGGQPEIFGDGETIRDFCHINDVVRANILAATTNETKSINNVYNIGSGQKTSLNELFSILCSLSGRDIKPAYKPFRAADIRISCADISRAVHNLDFNPSVNLRDGLLETVGT